MRHVRSILDDFTEDSVKILTGMGRTVQALREATSAVVFTNDGRGGKITVELTFQPSAKQRSGQRTWQVTGAVNLSWEVPSPQCSESISEHAREATAIGELVEKYGGCQGQYQPGLSRDAEHLLAELYEDLATVSYRTRNRKGLWLTGLGADVTSATNELITAGMVRVSGSTVVSL